MPLGLDGDKWCHNCGAAYLYWDIWEHPRRFWRSPSNNVEHKDEPYDPTPPVDWRARLEGLETFVRKIESQWETRFDRIANHLPAAGPYATDARVSDLYQRYQLFLDGYAKLLERVHRTEVKLQHHQPDESAVTSNTDAKISGIDLEDIIYALQAVQSYVHAMLVIFNTTASTMTKHQDFQQAKSDAMERLQYVEMALRKCCDNEASDD